MRHAQSLREGIIVSCSSGVEGPPECEELAGARRSGRAPALPEFLTTAEAAEFLGVHPDTIRGLAKGAAIRRELRPRPRLSPVAVYRLEDLHRLKEARTLVHEANIRFLKTRQVGLAQASREPQDENSAGSERKRCAAVYQQSTHGAQLVDGDGGFLQGLFLARPPGYRVMPASSR